MCGGRCTEGGRVFIRIQKPSYFVNSAGALACAMGVVGGIVGGRVFRTNHTHLLVEIFQCGNSVQFLRFEPTTVWIECNPSIVTTHNTASDDDIYKNRREDYVHRTEWDGCPNTTHRYPRVSHDRA